VETEVKLPPRVIVINHKLLAAKMTSSLQPTSSAVKVKVELLFRSASLPLVLINIFLRSNDY